MGEFPVVPEPATPDCGCVPPLSAPAERLSALRHAVSVENEPLVTLTHLLRLCRDEHPLLREHQSDRAARESLASLRSRLLTVLPPPGARTILEPHVQRELAAALNPSRDVPAVVVARALAEAIDTHYGASFSASFRARSPYQPVFGDPIPLDSPDLRRITSMAPTAPPWRLANRLDETRRVRLAGSWTAQFRVVFDYGLFDTLAGLVEADTTFVTCHPNQVLSEFTLPLDARAPVFPIQPRDVEGQRARLGAVLEAAAGAGANVVVLPELCLTEELAWELEKWVRRPDGPQLLVAGSFHHDDGRAGRVNRALTWVRGHPTPLVHDKHSPADRPVVEDIAPAGWPQLRVYVTADGWHLVIAICRDLLNPNAVHALTEAGANLVLVPAMSETLVAFGGPAAQLVGCGQALVVIANNPADWSDPTRPGHGGRPARALFGHPGLGQQTRLVQSPDSDMGLSLLQVRTGQLGWQSARGASASSTAGLAQRDTTAGAPDWVERLATHVRARPASGSSADAVLLRPAAVLVLLTDGPQGPEVMLTGRAPDLADYPDRVVFPGGLVEPTDAGPEAAALREAAEEVGLDPTSVKVIGALAPFGLPDSGFLVTPVLAWSAQPQFTQSMNLAEVTTVRTVPISQCTLATPSASAPHATHDEALAELATSRLGTMTATVLDVIRAFLAIPPPTVAVPRPSEQRPRVARPDRRPATSSP